MDTHFWPVTLDLLKKAAYTLPDRQDAALAAAIDRLTPLLEQHLGPYAGVTLREITEETMGGICRLSETLQEPQTRAVATNVMSLAQALFSQYAWYRAIYAGKAAAGFMMLYDNPAEKSYFLWRFMIAEPYQRRGYAAQAIQRLVEYVRTRPGATELGLSCIEGEGSPEGFYAKQGFTRTGEKDGGEIIMKVKL